LYHLRSESGRGCYFDYRGWSISAVSGTTPRWDKWWLRHSASWVVSEKVVGMPKDALHTIPLKVSKTNKSRGKRKEIKFYKTSRRLSWIEYMMFLA
jgi:hypothetical protein